MSRGLCVSVLSVGDIGEPCQNGCTDRDAVCAVDLGVTKEPCIIRWDLYRKWHFW